MGTDLIRITQTVLGNEKAYGLVELHMQSPNSKGFHRYQIILVNRDGHRAEFRRDMGLARNFKGVNSIILPSYWEHTVDELMGLADELRDEAQANRQGVKELLQLEHYKPA